MPRGSQVPTMEGFITDLYKKIGILERKLQAVVDTRRTPLFLSFDGPLELIESPPLRTIHPTQIDLIVPQVGTPPSGGDLTIDLSLAGTPFRTLTIPDGQTYVEDAISFVIPAGGYITFTPTAINGAEDLAIALIPKLI